MPGWLDVTVRLSRAPVVSIASIRGRARGAGSEFILACDLRFCITRGSPCLASLRWARASFRAAVPWPGSPGWLDVGVRWRFCSSPTTSTADAPNECGYVNRAIADNELDAEVEAMALRLAAFDRDGDRTNQSTRRSGDAAARQRVSARAAGFPSGVRTPRDPWPDCPDWRNWASTSTAT